MTVMVSQNDRYLHQNDRYVSKILSILAQKTVHYRPGPPDKEILRRILETISKKVEN